MFINRSGLFPFLLFQQGGFNPLAVSSAELLQWLYSTEKTEPENNPDASTLIDTSTLGDDRTVQPGRGYLFDGVDDYVTAPVSLTGNFNLSFYFTAANTGATQQLFDNRIGSGLGVIIVVLATGEVLARVNTLDVEITTVITYNDSLPHFLECSYDGSTLTLTIDGNTLTDTGTAVLSSVGDLYLGARTPNVTSLGNYLNGSLWDVRATFGSASVHYKADEGDGTTAYDSSGNADHGTITNATLSTFHTTFTDGSGSDYQNQVGYSDGVNYIKYSEDFSNALWILPTGTKTHNQTDPLGGTTATLIQPNSTNEIFNQSFNGTAGEVRTYSIWMRSATGSDVNLNMYINNPTFTESSGGAKVVTTAWQRFDVSHTLLTTGEFRVTIGGFSTFVTGEDIYVAFAQLNDGLTPLDYQKTVDVALGGTLVPRDESDTSKDVTGAALQYTGRVPYDGLLVNSNCATFDGVDDYVSFPIKSYADGESWEISFRVYYEDNGQQYALITGSSDNQGQISFKDLFVDRISFRYIGGATYFPFGSAVPLLNQWAHYRFVCDGTNIVLFINGVESGTATPTQTNIDFDRVGNAFGTSSYSLKGRLADYEIAGHCYLPLSEGAGTTIYDVSGNANHGTATNITPANFWANTQDEFHYNIKNGFSDGVNIVANSADFSTTWYNTGSTDNNPGTITDPTGASNGTEIVNNGVATNFFISQNVTLPADGNYIFSVYLKADTVRYVRLRFTNFTDASYSEFDLQTGTIVTNPSSGTIEDIGGGWYRCAVKSTQVTDLSGAINIYALAAPNDPNFTTPSTALKFFTWGGQLEQSITTTPYQPTTGAKNIGALVPADTNGYIPNGLTDAPSNPAINGHNNAETQINRNPVGAPELVNASVPLNDTISFGDDFTLSDPPYDYKRDVTANQEQDYLVYDSEPSAGDLVNLADWLASVAIFALAFNYAGNSMYLGGVI